MKFKVVMKAITAMTVLEEMKVLNSCRVLLYSLYWGQVNNQGLALLCFLCFLRIFKHEAKISIHRYLQANLSQSQGCFIN